MREDSLTHGGNPDVLIDELTERFATVHDRLVFGSLIYPTIGMSYRTNVAADAFHFFQRVLRKCPRRIWGDPDFKRLFVMEETDSAGRHIHFLSEIPKGMTREAFNVLCLNQWYAIALRKRREAEWWKELSCGTRLHPTEPRTILIKGNRIVRPHRPSTHESTWSQFASTLPNHLKYQRYLTTPTTRPLVEVKPVTNLRGVISYCVKQDDLNCDPKETLPIKGHSSALSWW
jgi:hypothetical protein